MHSFHSQQIFKLICLQGALWCIELCQNNDSYFDSMKLLVVLDFSKKEFLCSNNFRNLAIIQSFDLWDMENNSFSYVKQP